MKSQSSATLSISEIQPGAILATPVHGADGQILMTAGSELTEAAIEKLATRGVLTLDIEVQRDEAELNAAREVLRQRLARLFRGCDIEDTNSEAHQLFEAVLSYRLESLQ